MLQRAPRRDREEALALYALTPFTLQDFPDRTACIIWCAGCNMRCGYCHNPQMVRGKGCVPLVDVIAFLDKRQGLLDGVVLSGGEATLYPDLDRLIAAARARGFAVKLDTNGTRPDRVAQLLQQGVLDYVALDYKAPAAKFRHVTGIDSTPATRETLAILTAQTRVPFEVRTTVHTDLLDESDIAAIMEDLAALGFRGTYAVQNFRAQAEAPTLGAMPPQRRVLNPALLPAPRGFRLSLRNF